MDQGTEDRSGGTPPMMPRRPAPLAVVERLDRDGRVMQADPVHAWPVSLGRALDCDVILDDPHVAARHAVLDASSGQPVLQVGETVNGAVTARGSVGAGQRLTLQQGEIWRLGTTRLRVRLPSDPLPAERPLSRHAMEASAPHAPMAAGWRSLVLLAAAVLGWTWADQWLSSDPGSGAAHYLGSLMFTATGLGVWALFWSLGSKLFQGRLHYWLHLRLALRYVLIWSAVTAVLPMAAFVSGWVILSRIAELVGMVVLCALLLAHLSVLLPGRRRALALGLGLALVVGTGLSTWLQHQRQARWFSELYLTTLLPPPLRLAPPAAHTALIEDARSLRAKLDELARASDEGDDEPASEDEE